MAKIAHKHKALLVVDNTLASPVIQRPLELGADIVVHSMTKYLGGHSDAMGGAVVVNKKKLRDELYYYQNAIGAIPGTQECMLLLRSLKTLAMRMERHSTSGLRFAKFLSKHKKVKKVYYPGLPGNQYHKIAKKQMNGFGGMISFELKGGLKFAKKFLKKLKLFPLAVSLGAVESLIEHPWTMSHFTIPAAEKKRVGITEGLIRVSVGVEDVNDLIEDFKQALK